MLAAANRDHPGLNTIYTIYYSWSAPFFRYYISSLADLQAHNVSHNDTLWACRLDVFAVCSHPRIEIPLPGFIWWQHRNCNGTILLTEYASATLIVAVMHYLLQWHNFFMFISCGSFFLSLFSFLFLSEPSSFILPWSCSEGPHRLCLSILTRNVALSQYEYELHPWLCGLLFLTTNWCHDKFRQG